MNEEFIKSPKRQAHKKNILLVTAILVITLFLHSKENGWHIFNKQDNKKSEILLSSEYLQSLCPFRLPCLGKVQRISVNEDNVIFHFFVNEAEDSIWFDADAISRNEEKSIDLAMVEVQGTQDTLREVVKQIAAKEMTLIFDVIGNKGRYGRITLSTEQIRESLKRMPFLNEYDFRLNAIAKANRLLLPMKVDEITELIDVELTNNDYVYVYRIDDSRLNIHKIDMVVQKEVTYNELKENKMILKNIIEGCNKTNRGIIYRYISKWNRETNGFHIWPEEVYFDDEDS